MILKSFSDLQHLIFRVTPHAIQRFKERVNPNMSEEEIKRFLCKAWREARMLHPYVKGGIRCSGRGVVFGVTLDNGVVTVITVHGREDLFIWNRETFRKAAARGVLRWR
ncbi:MAG: hypothetical protein ACPL5F_10560 [Moorellaceae bacterium]